MRTPIRRKSSGKISQHLAMPSSETLRQLEAIDHSWLKLLLGTDPVRKSRPFLEESPLPLGRNFFSPFGDAVRTLMPDTNLSPDCRFEICSRLPAKQILL